MRKLVTGDRVRGIKSGRVGEVQGPGTTPDLVTVLWDGVGIPMNTARKYLRLLGSPASDVTDMINHPPHYTSGPRHTVCGETIEVIDLTEPLGFCLGNVVKYVLRCDRKGAPLEDLAKARWYLDREIDRRTRGAAS